jgi:hypothetical protein
VTDAEVLLERREDLVAAHDRAEGVGADADGVVPDGVALVLAVERRDRGHLGRDRPSTSAHSSMPSELT